VTEPPTRPDLDIVIEQVRRRHNDVAVNLRLIESFREALLTTETQVLLRYMVCGDLLKVAAWANEKGWKFKPAVGNRRNYKASDVHSMLANPPEGWTPEMVRLVKDGCFDERGMLNTGKMMG
jgi:hypothetical protein